MSGKTRIESTGWKSMCENYEICVVAPPFRAASCCKEICRAKARRFKSHFSHRLL